MEERKQLSDIESSDDSSSNSSEGSRQKLETKGPHVNFNISGANSKPKNDVANIAKKSNLRRPTMQQKSVMRISGGRQPLTPGELSDSSSDSLRTELTDSVDLSSKVKSSEDAQSMKQDVALVR